MPIFAALFSSLFSALGIFLAKLFAAKLAIRVAGVVALTAIGGTLMAAFNSHIAPLVATAFSTQYGQVIGLAFPPIAGTCIATIMALWIACVTYKMQARAISLTAGM